MTGAAQSLSALYPRLLSLANGTHDANSVGALYKQLRPAAVPPSLLPSSAAVGRFQKTSRASRISSYLLPGGASAATKGRADIDIKRLQRPSLSVMIVGRRVHWLSLVLVTSPHQEFVCCHTERYETPKYDFHFCLQTRVPAFLAIVRFHGY